MQKVPQNYKGPLRFELYCDLQKRYPQRLEERDSAWLKRMTKHCTLADMEFRDKLSGVMYRKRCDQVGMVRKNNNALPQTMQHIQQASRQYVGGKSAKQQDERAFKKLVDDFCGRTPHNGSIFWNGVNATSMARCVAKWNDLDNVSLGQLEATTNFKYANGAFQWRGAFEKFTTEASAKLGVAASGHVTAVVMCGMRDTSVLTKTELPRILSGMMDGLTRPTKKPRVTDITIVVLSPIHNAGIAVDVLTNNQIKAVKIVKHNGNGYGICGRNDCNVVGDLQSKAGLKIPWQIRDWWSGRPLTEPVAAKKIVADYQQFWYGG
ncbi:hypothetical protein OAH18_03490 [bacterium]|nr:hypothetical protein [bacterium]